MFLKKLIYETIKIITIYIYVCFSWVVIELLLIGEMKPNKVDDIIALILSFSLYLNYRLLEEKKANNNIQKYKRME